MENSRPAIEQVAGALAVSARATMLVGMMDGRYWTAGELARLAGVSPSSASEHIDRLLAVGLVRERRQGRHRYLVLAGGEVAKLVELLGGISEGVLTPTRSLRVHRADAELRQGRTCYRHLAGELGIQVLDAWRMAGWVDEFWQVTDVGLACAQHQGWTLRRSQTGLLRPCVDWTLRRDHAAGEFADRLTTWAFEQEYLVRGAHPRSARLTPSGTEFVAGLRHRG